MEEPKLLDELLLEPKKPTFWLVEPFVAEKGITFLYGKPTIGKSPLTWKLAQVVSDGGDFFGFPARMTGPVLYIEVDTRKELVRERLERLQPRPRQAYWAFFNPFNILHPPTDIRQTLDYYQQKLNPVLVIWNTLRKVTTGIDLIDGDSASMVYSMMMRFFPNAGHFVNHHDKKSNFSKESRGDPDEAFSGSQAWLNDAQVGLHLLPVDKKLKKSRLEHTKSQLSELIEPLDLQLSEDGTNWMNLQASAVVGAFLKMEGTVGARVKALAKEFDQSEKTIRRKLTAAGVIGHSPHE